MTTFDRWEGAVQPPEDYLMHFRTKGSKNGIRRYQTESGEWTPLGLAERRKREGWGEDRKVRKAEKRLERAERKQAKKEAKAVRKAAKAEERRKRSLKGLTDDEMRQKLERAKMEAEYRDLTKKSSLVETGAKLVTKYLDYKDRKEQRVIDQNRMKVDMARAKADIIRAQEGTKRAKAEARKAKEDRKTMEANVEGGLKKERKTNLINAKKEYKNYTIRGGIARRINMSLTSGYGKRKEAMRKAKSDVETTRFKAAAQRKDNQLNAQRAADAQKKAQRQAEAARKKRERADRKNAKLYGSNWSLN